MREPRCVDQMTNDVHAFLYTELNQVIIWTMSTLLNVNTTTRDIDSPPSNEIKPIALPESTTDGVSTRNVQPASNHTDSPNQSDLHWYAMRTTYGREKKAYEYIIGKGTEAFYPTSTIEKKDKDGKMIRQTVSRLPNIFFIHTTEEVAKSYAYDKKDLHYLRFYYNQHHDGTKEPLIVPDRDIINLRILCQSHEEDILIVPQQVHKFEIGQIVRVTKGPFAGIEGTVARWHGQQRVGITIGGLCVIATTYVPTQFIESIV